MEDAIVLLYRHQSAAEFLQHALFGHATAAAPVLSVTYTVDDYGAPDPIVEGALGADLGGSSSLWEWTDLSDRLVPQSFTIKRGRADEASRGQPATVSLTLENGDGALTPGNAMSVYWPNVVRNTPLRVRIPGGSTATYMVLDSDLANNASTPDAASLDITGDLGAWFDGDIDWTRSDNQTALVGKWKALSDERSYLFYITNGGRLSLLWSSTGDYTTYTWAVCDVALPFGGDRHAVGCVLDADTGGGTWSVTFYTADTAAGAWTQLGDVQTHNYATGLDTGPTLSIYNGTAPLEVGPSTGELSTPPDGKVYSAGVRSAASLTSGTIVANPDFGAQAAGTDTFADTAAVPKTWTLNGAAVISDFDDTRVRFAGQIDAIDPTWPEGDNSGTDPATSPAESQVDVNASGFLRRLGQGDKALASPLYRAATAPSPQLDGVQLAYWPCEDERDATQFSSPIPGVGPLMFGGDISLAADSDHVGSKPLPHVANSAGYGFSGDVPLSSYTEWSFNVFVNVPTMPGSEIVLFAVECPGSTVALWHIAIDATNVRLRGYSGPGGTLLVSNAGVATDFTDGWTMVYLQVVQEGGNIRYRNGWATVDGIVIGSSNTIAGTVTAPSRVATLTTAPADGLSFGHIGVCANVRENWLGWDSGANLAYAGERAGRRLQRLGTEEGVRVRIIGDPDDTERMGPQGTQTLLDLLQECATADGGILHEERHRLGLVYRTRASLENQAAALALDASTRVEGGLVVADIVNPFAPTLDDQRIRNDVTCKRDGGSKERAVTDPAPAPADLYDEEVTLNVDSDLRLADQAQWRLHLGTWPGMRYPSVSTELSDAPHLLEDWLLLDLGDRITVDNLPSQHPVTTVDVLAEGYDETYRPDGWRVQVNCSAGGPWHVGVREDATEPARRDTSATTLSDDMTLNDTNVLFVIDSGPDWTEEAGDYPFDIDVNGERMTAENITDLGGGEWTFEVIRGVNGVQKEHFTGETLRLWQPTYRAF